MDLKYEQLEDYRENEKRRFRVYDSSFGLQQKRSALDSIDRYIASRDDELRNFKNMNRVLDLDFRTLEEEIKDRNLMDEELFEEQKGLMRERENFQMREYMDVVEQHLMMVQRDNAEVKGFLKHITSIDQTYGSIVVL